jgi:TolB protein
MRWRVPAVLGGLIALAVSIHSQAARTVYYHNPDWSPNGSRIVFESTRDGKYAIYTIRADGSDLRKLTDGEADDEQPRWSRDGRQIVFISNRDGHLQLYLMDADGSRQRRLTKTNDIDYQPDFSPKGDYVAFQSRTEQAAVVHDIYTIRADGTGRTRLTDRAADYAAPKWSPDGKKILFERAATIKRYYRDMTPEERNRMRASKEIFVMNRDGSDARNLTNNDVRDASARWSRDGRTIYFVSDRGGEPGVYAMRADGSDVRKVADGKVVAQPNVSPDGKYFVYTKEVQGKWGLYRYDIKAGSERLLIGG